MESKVCGGCGSSGFVTLMTTNENGERLDRLAYLQTVKDVPPMPVVGDELRRGGELTLRFYELWNEPTWKDLFGDEPTIASLAEVAKMGTIRLSKIIKSPSGITRARIYDIATATWEPIGDEECEGFPSLHKNLRVRGYASTTMG